ncbi:unnamed protein product [Hyaloperonospora brassicae]|uniref:Uncharacterized protein n=1 Tax=Hyaloperonospora brassicae TaxID=162125 RepID=A0AAV0UJ06_HYABA|nr:unnamed protein product [Hyaloperonospora brassicae]
MDQRNPVSLTSPSLDLQPTPLAEPEPQLDVSCPVDTLSKKVEEASRHISLELDETETMAEAMQEETKDMCDERNEVISGGEGEEVRELDAGDETVVDRETEEKGEKKNERATTAAVATTATATTTAVLAATNDKSRLSSLERTSLDTIKASGTRAVGSLFSRFKGGRAKKMAEPATLSPIKAAAQPLEVLKEASRDDVLPMATNMESDGRRKQSIGVVSAEEKKGDDLEKATAAAEEMPSRLSNGGSEVSMQLNIGDDDVHGDIYAPGLTSDTSDCDGVEQRASTKTGHRSEKLSNVATWTPLEGAVEPVETVGVTTAVVTLEDEKVSVFSSVDAHEEESVRMAGLTESTSELTINTDAEDEAVSSPVQGTANKTAVAIQSDTIAAKFDTVSRQLEGCIDLDMQPADVPPLQAEAKAFDNSGAEVNEVASELTKTEVVEEVARGDMHKIEDAYAAVTIAAKPLVSQLDGTVLSNEATSAESSEMRLLETFASDGNEHGNISVTDSTGLLRVEATPPTSKSSSEVCVLGKAERVSPVKSLASRFEGKREQSLDSLKFRTVRGFFSDERSIRVGAEKEKYEAQAQQQKVKAKAEEVVKSKYKTTSGYKSLETASVLSASSPEDTLVTMNVQDAAIIGVSGVSSHAMTTPDATASRKEFSYDEENAGADSPSKSSDDAGESLTPVKSIASRFEGKREQSLDTLKFRTVREFFPTERRTRSVHVGAEKAKYEALTRQHDVVTTAAEQPPLSSADPMPFPIALTGKSNEAASSAAASSETSSRTPDDPDEIATICSVRGLEMADGENIESSGRSADHLASAVLNETSNTSISLDKLAVGVDTSDTVPCLDAESVPVDTDNAHSIAEVRHGVEESKAATAGETARVDIEPADTLVMMDNYAKLDQGDKATVNADSRLDKPETEGNSQHAELALTEETCTTQHESNKHDDEETGIGAEAIEPGIVDKVDGCLDAEEAAMVELDNSKSEVTTGGACNQENSALADELVQVVESNTAKSDVVDEDAARVEEVEETTLKSKAVEVLDSVIEISHLDPSVVLSDEVAVGRVESACPSVQQHDIDGENPRDIGTESAESAKNEVAELELDGSVAETSNETTNEEAQATSRPMLTTERSFVIEDDHIVETEDTVVVKERPMTDGEEELEVLSPSKVSAAHELHSDVTSSRSAKSSTPKVVKQTSSKVARKKPTELPGSVKMSLGKPVDHGATKRASTAASRIAKEATKAEGNVKAPLPVKMKTTAPKRKSTVSGAGSAKVSTAPPSVSARMKRASATPPTAMQQVGGNLAGAGEAGATSPATATQSSKRKGLVGFTSAVEPASSLPIVADGSKRASIVASPAFREAKKAERNADVASPVPSAPARNKRYSSVKSIVQDGIKTHPVHAVSHVPITKEAYIAAERRKSLGSAGVRCVLDAANRRASLTARAAIGEPPEPYIRSALSRKKLKSTVPRYMNYENTPGYAERARQQYERRKRLEEENAAKSEKRQRELRSFFDDKQQKSLTTCADIVRRGLEAHEFAKMVKESKTSGEKATRSDRQRSRTTRSHRRALSSTSSACTSSSNGASSRASKKSSALGAIEKPVEAPGLEATTLQIQEAFEPAVVTEEELTLEEVYTETQEAAIVGAQADSQTAQVSAVKEVLSSGLVAETVDDDD